MSKSATATTEENTRTTPLPERPRSSEIAGRGIETGHDFADLMSSIRSDVIDGRLTPKVANAVCNAGGKLLKVVEMQIQHGTNPDDKERKTLRLTR